MRGVRGEQRAVPRFQRPQGRPRWRGGRSCFAQRVVALVFRGVVAGRVERCWGFVAEGVEPISHLVWSNSCYALASSRHVLRSVLEELT
eukprot:11204147-Lingulodinium_polyedra.AAC.1